jgi:hypothetical protein
LWQAATSVLVRTQARVTPLRIRVFPEGGLTYVT